MYFERLEVLYETYKNYSILSKMLNVNRSTIKRWFDSNRIPKRSLTKNIKSKISYQLKKLTDLSYKQDIPFETTKQFIKDVIFKLKIMRIRYKRFKCLFGFKFCLSGEERQKGTSNFLTFPFDAKDILEEEINDIMEVHNVVNECSGTNTSTECLLISSQVIFF
jgi:hypothetical protein